MNTPKSTEDFDPYTTMLDRYSADQIVLTVVDQYRSINAVRERALQIAYASEKIAQCIRKGGRLIYVGAGTSGRIAALDAAECVPTFGIPEGVITAVMAGGPNAFTHAIEGAEDNTHLARVQMHALDVTDKDVVCGIAASGTTPFTLAALEYARSRFAFTILVHNAELAESMKMLFVNMRVHLDTGPEVLNGSTRLRAGTAQKLFCNALTTTICTLLGYVYGGLMVDVKVTNKKLRTRAERIVRLLTGVSELRSSELLDEGGNSAKTAVVMHHRHMNREEAKILLEKHGGRLRDIIGDIDYTKVKF